MLKPFFWILNRPLVWEAWRVISNFFFRTYKDRVNLMQQWGLFDPNLSVIDIGCGTAPYAQYFGPKYLGIDRHAQYIDHAKQKYKNVQKDFQCGDVRRLADQPTGPKFDISLLVDILHHLNDEDAIELIRTSQKLSKGIVLNFEPVYEQDNFVARWLIDNDRGEYMRTSDQLIALYRKAGLEIKIDYAFRMGIVNSRVIVCAGGQHSSRFIENFPHRAKEQTAP